MPDSLHPNRGEGIWVGSNSKKAFSSKVNDMCISGQKGYVGNAPLMGVGESLKTKSIIRNKMKCPDLHRKCMSLTYSILGGGGIKCQKY